MYEKAGPANDGSRVPILDGIHLEGTLRARVERSGSRLGVPRDGVPPR